MGLNAKSLMNTRSTVSPRIADKNNTTNVAKDILNFNWTQITQIYTDKKNIF
jgi:hypothetical protein